MDFPQLDLRFNEYETKPETEIPFEAHRKLWDLQLVLEGEEMIGAAPIETLTETVPYDEANDIAFYKGSGSTVKLSRAASAGAACAVGRTPPRRFVRRSAVARQKNSRKARVVTAA